MGKTLFEKVWDAHVVHSINDNTQIIYEHDEMNK